MMKCFPQADPALRWIQVVETLPNSNPRGPRCSPGHAAAQSALLETLLSLLDRVLLLQLPGDGPDVRLRLPAPASLWVVLMLEGV